MATPDELGATTSAAAADRVSLDQLKNEQKALATKNAAMEGRVAALETTVNTLVNIISPADMINKMAAAKSKPDAHTH